MWLPSIYQATFFSNSPPSIQELIDHTKHTQTLTGNICKYDILTVQYNFDESSGNYRGFIKKKGISDAYNPGNISSTPVY